MRHQNRRGSRRKPGKPRIFIVYGHDPVKAHLAAYLRQLDLEPILLCHQPREGRTLLEQVDHWLRRAAFVIVLLTGDDEGHAVGHPDEKKARARQNVVLELGMALGLVGRRRILVLHRRGVELPSDLQGLHYVEIGNLGEAKLRIVAELKAAKIPVDANKAF